MIAFLAAAALLYALISPYFSQIPPIVDRLGGGCELPGQLIRAATGIPVDRVSVYLALFLLPAKLTTVHLSRSTPVRIYRR